MKEFKKLGLPDAILKVIEKEAFEEPTEIQTKAIPLVLAGKDVIGGSATGSGKTLVFGARIIENSEKRKVIQALVLTPTRELAEQITRSLKKFSRYKPLEIIPIYGGVSINPQIQALRFADVVVATPGRLLDHIQRRTIKLSRVKILVIDEADRLFDMGFINDVEKIIREIPQKRQTLLFSATISREINSLSARHMRNPVKVSAESYVDPKKLKQVYYDVSEKLKFSLLAHLLKKDHSGLTMVFCNTRITVDFVAKNLEREGIMAMPIHGGFSQAKRSNVMGRFHSKKVEVLVCTDVAARGLDIKGVSHIYNYDIPGESKNFIHRVGRTARAGKEGKSITLLSRNQHNDFRGVIKISNFDIRKEETPDFVRLEVSEKKKPVRFERRKSYSRNRRIRSKIKMSRSRGRSRHRR